MRVDVCVPFVAPIAIYTHTRSLVIAAPMAHYLAMRGSRYEFSHKIQYVPVKSVSRMSRGQEVSMHFTQSEGKDEARVAYCSAMDYMYRSTNAKIENLSLWQFHKGFKRVDKKDVGAVVFTDPSRALPIISISLDNDTY